LQLLQYFARELSNMRVLVAGNYRDTELARSHPLSQTIVELNREGGFLRLALRGLTREETESYIHSTANAVPPRALVDRIFEETEGNPFFLSEVVNLMAQEGTLTADSVSNVVIPDGVREALGRRLDRLSDECNQLLTIAAVIGREFTYDTLVLLHEGTDRELVTYIDEGLGGQVIEEMEGRAGRYRFTHAQMQETLLSELSTTRLVHLNGEIAEALEERYGGQTEERAAPSRSTFTSRRRSRSGTPRRRCATASSPRNRRRRRPAGARPRDVTRTAWP
jgi:predicted ATPase